MEFEPKYAPLVTALEGRLGLSFRDRLRAVTALRHRSYCNEHRACAHGDNERLEFLGDAVIDLAIGAKLMQRLPQATEGELTKARATIVNEEGLSLVARELDLGALVLLGRGELLGGGREKPSVLANTLEAVLGAVFLEFGMDAVMELVDRVFAGAIEKAVQGSNATDYKSRLQEDAQSRLKAPPVYRVVTESGPDHAKVYEVEVAIADRSYGRRSGRSKKEAEQLAAKATLEMLSPNEGETG